MDNETMDYIHYLVRKDESEKQRAKNEALDDLKKRLKEHPGAEDFETSRLKRIYHKKRDEWYISFNALNAIEENWL